MLHCICVDMGSTVCVCGGVGGGGRRVWGWGVGGDTTVLCYSHVTCSMPVLVCGMLLHHACWVVTA
jgi:hypothetical protein